MTNSLSPSEPFIDRSSASSERVVRTPFYFDSQGRSCFAWLHHAKHACNLDHGVVLCSPLGHEQVHAHRSLRHLGDHLAEARFAVVRFDFHGTGDSSGSDEDADRLTAWLENLRDVQWWMRQQLGCRRISLIGLRLGAALAAQAAVEQSVDCLILWTPVIKGGSYVREMKALSLTTGGPAPSSSTTANEIEAAGFVLTQQTLRDVENLDLMQIRPLCRRVLILSREDARHDISLLEHFKAHGIEARHTVAPGYADMMTEPHYNQVPWIAINTMVDWLETEPLIPNRVGEESDWVESMNPTSVIPAARASIHTDPGSPVIHESALHISSEPHLFGILSESARTPPKELPTIVFINAGSTYRAGPSRLYVFLSRHLARQGFRCLRMDLCGLGDSITSHFSQENNPYPATSFRDIDITLNYLTHCMGIERIVLMGLCSGAYAAFQSAAQLSNPALVESVLINPLTFYWCDGMSLETSPALQIKSFQECMASVRQPEKWLKFLTGRSKLGISGALRMLVQRWRMWHPSRGESARPGVGMHLEQLPTHPVHEDLVGDLERIAVAGRHLACFFARSDPGYALLMLNAKRETNQLQNSGRMSVHFLDEADHTFSRRAARHALGLEITQHLLRRYRVGSGWGQE